MLAVRIAVNPDCQIFLSDYRSFSKVQADKTGKKQTSPSVCLLVCLSRSDVAVGLVSSQIQGSFATSKLVLSRMIRDDTFGHAEYFKPVVESITGPDDYLLANDFDSYLLAQASCSTSLPLASPVLCLVRDSVISGYYKVGQLATPQLSCLR